VDAYLLDWANLIARWTHLVTGIAWIGASFYFVWLDNHLRGPATPADRARGALGELWSVHGGGFYHNRKFLTGPKGEPLTEDLHWFKWEAYSTWLSGMALLAIVYWFGASTYLIDRGVLDWSPAAAIAASAAFLALGWFVYDALCRVLAKSDLALLAAVFGYVVLASWLAFHLFSARAAFLHVGAMMGTVMVANVFFVIIPGQRRMVAEIRAGREPDPAPGLRGKQRSTHNTYFTLPVLFAMISNHYPMTYASRHGWLTLVAIMLAGVLVRIWFVQRHKGRSSLALPAAATALIAALAFALAPAMLSRQPTSTAAAPAFDRVHEILKTRCVACHAASPTQPGFAQAPKGVLLETPQQIAQHVAKVQETVASRYMPIGNLTAMTDEERAVVAAWYAAGAGTN
jgi:uncharacterized membrane protein